MPTQTYGDGASLVAALSAASFGEDIRPTAALAASGGTLTLTAPLSNNFNSVQLFGATNPATGMPNIFLSGGSTVRIFGIRGNENVTFTDLGFIDGQAMGTGAAGFGGAVTTDHNHVVTFNNCVFTNNSASGGGGAIDTGAGGGNLNLNNCTFTNNTSGGSGGAITLRGVTANLTDTTFTGNTANGSGGAIEASGSPGTLNVLGGAFTNNTATNGVGGALDLVLYTLNDTPDALGVATTFSGNMANTGGGAIDASGVNPYAYVYLAGATLSGNMTTSTAGTSFGGALEATNVSVYLAYCAFTGNGNPSGTATTRAGAADLFANQPGYAVVFDLQDTTFTNNTATGSGALILSEQSGSSADALTGFVSGCTFDGNTSTSTGATVGFGGGANFYAQGYSADLAGDNGSAAINVGRSANGPTEFKNNKSAVYGGGFAATAFASYGATATITLGDTDGATPSLLVHDNTSFAANSPLLGAGMYLQTKSLPNAAQPTAPVATVVLQHANVYNNTSAGSSSNGGGVYVENDSLAPTGSAEVDIVSSTIHDNSTAGKGGGVFVGLQSLNAATGLRSKVVFTNDTLFQNATTGSPTTASGGGIYVTRVLAGNSDAEVDLSSSTVAKNTAAAAGGNLAIADDPSLTVKSGNSIYANGTASMAGTADVSGTVTSVAGLGVAGGYNILQDASGGDHGFTDPTDRLGLDPLLNTALSVPRGALPVLEFQGGSPAVGTGDSVNWAGQPDETDYLRPATPTVGAYDPNATAPPGGGNAGGPAVADALWADADVVRLLSSPKNGSDGVWA